MAVVGRDSGSLNSALWENSKKPLSSAILTEASFNDDDDDDDDDDDSNKETLCILAILENKWNINYIQILPTQILQKSLRKILKRSSFTKKSTECKTWHPLKIDAFK